MDPFEAHGGSGGTDQQRMQSFRAGAGAVGPAGRLGAEHEHPTSRKVG